MSLAPGGPRLPGFFPEDGAENQPDQRTAVKHLIENGHGKIHSPGLDPGPKGFGILKEDTGNETHDRTHDAADADGNSVGDELGLILQRHDGEGQDSGNFPYDEELQNKGDGRHNGELVEGGQEGFSGYSSHIEGYVVDDHAVDHNDRHDCGKDRILKLVFGHKNILRLMYLCVVRYHPEECAFPIKTI